MLIDSAEIDAAAFTARTGWEVRPEGMCRGDVCVNWPTGMASTDRLDAAGVAAMLAMPLVHDEVHNLSALGPATLTTGRALDSAVAADPELVDFDGNPFWLSSLHGTKVVFLAWASW